jgi:hypothetical protein
LRLELLMPSDHSINPPILHSARLSQRRKYPNLNTVCGNGAVPAPALPRVGALAKASVSTLALATGLLASDAAWAACVNAGGGNWVCSAANTTAQSVSGNNANVTTVPGFGITAPAGVTALTISGQGAQSYTDTNSSAIVANGFAAALYMSTTNLGATPGTTTINSNGSFSGYSGVPSCCRAPTLAT